MYTAFYGLREKPFALVPDPKYLFLAESHREALAHLLYGIDQAEGFICVTGEVGTGKTTICRTLLDRLGSETEIAFLFNPSRSGIELLQDISAEFGLPSAGLSRSELSGALNRFLLQKRHEHRRVLLIIDEAQNLSESTLEQVRLLSNLETSSSKLIQILLLGQPELDRKLDSPELRQLRQRISVRWGLHPLSAKETRAYVRHRLHVAAGAERDLFSDGALREIHRRTGGVPRLINVLCERVLLAGYVARAQRISVGIVKQSAREIPDARRRSLFTRSLSTRSPSTHSLSTSSAVRSFARRLGSGMRAGAVFAAGLVLGLAVAGGLIVGSTDWVRDWLKPLLSSAPQNPNEIAITIETPVSASPPFLASLEPEALLAESPADGGFDASATVIVRDPSAFASRSLEPVDPSRIEEMSEALDDGLAAGEFLAAVLDEEDEDLTRRDAANAILDSYGLDELDVVPPTDELAVSWIGERGLSSLAIDDGDFETLRSLNHPVLLRLRGESESESRLVALLRLEGDLASLHGVTSAGPLWVPIDEVLQQWDGEAWVVWNDFESIRPVLAFGEQGHSVSWLQAALTELGFYQGTPSGLFDHDTRDALRAFQNGRDLQPDGMAGPRTRMVLYQLLERYEVPRLVLLDEEDSG
jgi:general secretion pathway protein A